MGLLAGNDRGEETATKAKSSDDDGLNDSAATVQRPVPVNVNNKTTVKTVRATPPRVTPPEENPFAAYENDRLDDDGALPTAALIRPDLEMAKALKPATELDDKVPTAIAAKKHRFTKVMPATARPGPNAAAIIKTPMAMTLPVGDEPSSVPPPPSGPIEPAPDSAATRVGLVQPTAQAQAVITASNRPAFVSPSTTVPIAFVPPKKKSAVQPHRVALLLSMLMLAAALFIVMRRQQQANAVAAQPPAAEAFPAAAPPPPEVAPPALLPAPTVVAVASPTQLPAAPPVQAQPEKKARRHERAASRPAIPSRREQ